MSATLSLSHLLGHVPRTPASVHPLPWDPVLQTLPARLLPRSCLVRGIPSKSFPSEPGSGTQAAKEAGSGFRGPPRDPKDGGREHPAFGGSRMGSPLGGHVGLSTLAHVRLVHGGAAQALLRGGRREASPPCRPRSAVLSPNRVARAELQALGWEMRPLARGARSVGPQTPDVGRGGTGLASRCPRCPSARRGPRQQPRPSRTFIVVAGVVTSLCSTPPRSRK